MGYWTEIPLEKMTDSQWEGLCDGCGRCCLHKLEDFDSGEIYPTNVACRMLDLGTLRCQKYANRRRYVANCIDLRKDLDAALKWLPSTCAYRRIHEGADLPDWHPLITGDPLSAVKADHSLAFWAVSEKDAGDYEDHIIDQEI